MDYDSMSHEVFVRILCDLIDETNAQELLRIPGVHDILSEHFNNEVLERREREQPATQPHDEIDNQYDGCDLCGLAGIGDECDECGRTLCHICYSGNGGFCGEPCPTDSYQPPGDGEDL